MIIKLNFSNFFQGRTFTRGRRDCQRQRSPTARTVDAGSQIDLAVVRGAKSRRRHRRRAVRPELAATLRSGRRRSTSESARSSRRIGLDQSQLDIFAARRKRQRGRRTDGHPHRRTRCFRRSRFTVRTFPASRSTAAAQKTDHGNSENLSGFCDFDVARLRRHRDVIQPSVLHPP